MARGLGRGACRAVRDRRVAALGMAHARRASGSGAAGLHAQLLVPQDVEHAAQRRRAGGALGLDRISAAGDRGVLAQAALAACGGRSNALCRDIRREPAVLALRRMRRPASHLADHRSPAPRLPGRLGRDLLRRGAADLLRRIRALPVADRRTGRDSGRARFRTSMARRRIRLATDTLAGLGDRQLSALGRLSPVREDARPRRRATSRLGRCRMGPALLPGIGRRAASFAGSNGTARRYHRIQRAGSCPSP